MHVRRRQQGHHLRMMSSLGKMVIEGLWKIEGLWEIKSQKFGGLLFPQKLVICLMVEYTREHNFRLISCSIKIWGLSVARKD